MSWFIDTVYYSSQQYVNLKLYFSLKKKMQIFAYKYLTFFADLYWVVYSFKIIHIILKSSNQSFQKNAGFFVIVASKNP